MKIELLYFGGCKWWKRTDEILQELLDELDIKASIKRIQIKSEEDTIKHRFIGSPTVRINGEDVHPEKKKPYFGCRTYRYKNETRPYPPKRMLRNALINAR